MSDEFGTVNVRRGDRAREIEIIRQHYRRHREALVNMTADAPTDHLANEYRRLVQDIDASLVKLHELEVGAPAVVAESAPGMRPLVNTPNVHEESASGLPEYEAEPRSRLPLIIVVALIALGVIAGLIWWASSDRGPVGGETVVEDTSATTVTTTVNDSTQAPPVPASELSVTPPSQDYGVIRKGTRATRQYEVTNNSDEPITVEIARSTCRCLYYEYEALLPPKAKESVTVTVDAARADVGPLRESIRVSAKSNPTVATSFDVIATVQ